MIARIRKQLENKEQGFTLVELLVVIIIIGILAAIAIPLYLNQQAKAKDSALKSDLKNAQIAVANSLVDDSTGAAALAMTAADFDTSPGVTLTIPITLDVAAGDFEICGTVTGGDKGADGMCINADGTITE